ncbi:MAG: hypothetical protein GX927_11340 [Lentisphaerae bacterium]|nr:hypothetical protein [Lentisphaerota bacterium]
MNDNTLLLRQVHPIFVQDGRASTQVFRPTPKDEQKLSVYDGDQITAVKAFGHYTQILKLKSCGVMAVSVAECKTLNLPVMPDPEPFPEHALIDFSDYGKNATEKKAKLLREKAVKRGWLYRQEGIA